MRKSHIDIHIEDPADFFIAPHPNPLSAHPNRAVGRSGIDEFARQVVNYPDLVSGRASKGHLRVILPKGKLPGNAAEELAQAIRRYAIVKIEDNAAEIRLMRRDGVRSFFHGLMFLALCTVVAAIIESPSLAFWPEFIRNIIGDGFTIIGWVMIWHPVEAFVYEPAAINAKNRLYRLLSHIRIEVIAEEV